ncbi:hypothetical protein SNOG_12203 [Parastagonospora nodorum SN15]|uniref:Uncharacterized protein n=1 Tax=Phaeosphaeria nodorum (strain SN15 / ATCC MYA-4574 / FGSC 10173) TaxID=321614 RepID=Q0U7R1_PHANO|nr:hypothetical protein SNOG_12203 [Parastagonospora nodorum SN15]EAT80615.1 hypothetical protein SNOG_12203 [Parastagonospora nodorum SN15]
MSKYWLHRTSVGCNNSKPAMTLLALLSLIFHRHFTMPAISTSGANLDTLPSELRKFTVPYLAPEVDNFRGGTHPAPPCLHEWVPEYMFKDMALKHVHFSALEDSLVELPCFHTPRNSSRRNSLSQMTLTIRGLVGVHWGYAPFGYTGTAGTTRQCD